MSNRTRACVHFVHVLAPVLASVPLFIALPARAAGPAVSFTVALPAGATAGAGATLTVTARDASNAVATGYRGTVHFSSTAADAVLPADYTFISGDSGKHSFAFTPGSSGALAITVQDVANPALARSGSTTVYAPPQRPVISAASPVTAGRAGSTASVVARPGMLYTWTLTNASIKSGGGSAGATGGGVNAITYTATAVGPVALTCLESNGAGVKSAAATGTVQAIAAPATPTITVQTKVTAGQMLLVASIAARAGYTYAWSIANGTITSGGSAAGVTAGTTNSVTFTAGAAGSLVVACAEVNAAGTASSVASKTVTVYDVPVAPAVSLTPPGPLTSGATGVVASVTARTGAKYRWTLTGGVITSTGGTAGVTGNGTNSITFRVSAAAPGTVILKCVETNGAGVAGAPSSATVAVVPPPPVTPVITAAAAVTAGKPGYAATAVSRTGMRYVWTLANGTITSVGGAGGVTSGGKNSITFTAGLPGDLLITCAETNGSQTSAPGSASAAVVPAPSTPRIATPGAATAGQAGLVASVTARAGMAYAWTVSNGTITNVGGTSGITTDGTNSVTWTSGAAGSATLTCVELNAAGDASGPGSAAVAISDPRGKGHLYFVAHEDDDVLFFDPDIGNSVRSGVPVQVVWVIAGGSGDGAAVWQAREDQARTALAAEAGVAPDWSCAYQDFAGQSVYACTLLPHPGVSAAFLRLPDGSSARLWATTTGAPFYVTPASTLRTADGVTTYARGQLIRTLAAMIGAFGPDRIGTMDSTFAYGDDHQDHVASALFALEGAHTWGGPHAFRIYRGYSVDLSSYGYGLPIPELVNLSSAELADKEAIMQEAYGLSCATGSFADFCGRHYAILKLAGGTGALHAGGLCLDTLGGASASGTPAVMAPCDEGLSQRWTIGSTGAFVAGGGRCLATALDGMAVQLADCAPGPSQSWTLFSNGQVRGLDGDCLTIASDGTSLRSSLCDTDRSASRYQPLLAQQFTQRAASPSAWRLPDSDGGGPLAPASSFRLGDIDGDGYADACIRLAGGLFCALNLHDGGLGPYRLMSVDFSDAAGWLPEARGSTLQLADVNGDGRADACARGASGIVCALATAGGTAFGPTTLWSTGGDFSDAAGFAVAASYYGSIRFADVNGDGLADVCARTSRGIACAPSAGLDAFAPATPWMTDDFTDALGWLPDQYGTTLQLGDVDGDGRADVCGRGPAGVRCAVADPAGTGFVHAHPWSFRGDFTDAAGWGQAESSYRSLRLADVNGDRLADLCARGPAGIVCAHSSGSAFDGARLLQSAFGDDGGWLPARYGTTVQFGDLDADGHADVCARGPDGLVCSTIGGFIAVPTSARVLYTPDRTQSPVTPDIAGRWRQAVRSGSGTRSQVFMKVGDSITANSGFLGCFDAAPSWGAYGALEGSRQYWGSVKADSASSSYGRTSSAAVVGTSSWDAACVDVLSLGATCSWDRSEVMKEFAVVEPQVAVVMFGTNDLDVYGETLVDRLAPYEAAMRKITDGLLARGVLPVLSTMPPRTDASGSYLPVIPVYTAVVRALAQARQIPLIDYNREMMALPSHGISGDGLHPTEAPDGSCDFTGSGPSYGFTLRNLVTMQALDRVRQALAGGPAPDADAPRLVGDGSPPHPFTATQLPFTDMRDVRTSTSRTVASYACPGAPSQPGPEYHYRLFIAQSTPVRIVLLDAGANAVQLNLLAPDGNCLASAPRTISTTLAAGTYDLVVDSLSATGGAEYTLVVVAP